MPLSRYLWNEFKDLTWRRHVFLTHFLHFQADFEGWINLHGDIMGNILFLMGQKEKSPEVRLCNQVGRGDEQVNSVPAPSIHNEMEAWQQPQLVKKTVLEIWSLQRYSSKWSLRWKQINTIRKYPWKRKQYKNLHFFSERIEARLMDMPKFRDYYECSKQCLFHVLRKLKMVLRI